MIEITTRKFVALKNDLASLMRSSRHIKFALLVNFGDHRSVAGAWSTQDNSIPALLARGVVFMTCHNAIWELARTLHAAGSNPGKLAIDALAADLTNHVIPQTIVTPGIVATVLELQQTGFHYAH